MSIRYLATIAIVLLSVSTANAWEIKSTGAGDAVRWPDGKIVVDVSMGAEAFGISQDMGESAAILALQHWSAEVPETLVLAVADREESIQELAQDGRNVIRWGVEAGPFVDPDALATTYLTYRTTTGEITEADIVVNAVDYEWTVVGHANCQGRYDLQNILTHEAGHFFGLSHSRDEAESTMFPSAGFCETSKRDLADDDKAGIDFLYNTVTLESTVPKDITEIVNCSTGGRSGAAVAALVLLVLFSLRRRAPKMAERRICGLTQKHAMTVLQRRRKIGEVRSWMTLPVILMVLLGSIASSEASTLRYLTPQKLAAQADLVTEGKIVSQRTELVSGWPVTFSTVEVIACHKRGCPKSIVVSQLGGEVGEVGLIVSGVSPLILDSTVLLFLRQKEAYYRPVAMDQGIFYSRKRVGVQVWSRELGAMHFSGDEKSDHLESLFPSDLQSVFGISMDYSSGK